MPLSHQGRLAGGSGYRGFGASAITVRGGRRLARFIELFSDRRATAQLMARAMAKVIERFVIPKLRAEVPVRTGRLRRSLRVYQRGVGVEIRSVFYGRFQRLGNDTLAERAVKLITDNRALIRAALRSEIRAELGI